MRDSIPQLLERCCRRREPSNHAGWIWLLANGHYAGRKGHEEWRYCGYKMMLGQGPKDSHVICDECTMRLGLVW